MHEINASVLARRCFQRNQFLTFCERLMEGGYHLQLSSLFATSYNMVKVTLVGLEIILSYDLIASAIGIPSHGEQWFKGMDLDIENYKKFLKPHAR